MHSTTTNNSFWSQVFGGEGGSSHTPFQNQNYSLTAVWGRASEFVVGLKFQFVDIYTGVKKWSQYYGGSEGEDFYWEVPHGQWVTKICVYSGGYVDSIQFFTNAGQQSPKFGGNGGSQHWVENKGKRFAGIKIKSGDLVDSISFYLNKENQNKGNNQTHHTTINKTHHTNQINKTKNQGNNTMGVTFSMFHAKTNPSVNQVDQDLNKIINFNTPSGGKFSSIRSYYPQQNGNIGLMERVNGRLNVLLGVFLFQSHGNPAAWTVDNISKYVAPYYNSANLKGILVGNQQGNAAIDVTLKYINQIRGAKPDIKISSAQTTGFWLSGASNALADKCTFIAANVYPAWQWTNPNWQGQPQRGGTAVTPQQGFKSFVDQYWQLKSKYNNKQVVVTETGWPTAYGHPDNFKQSQNGINNARQYFRLVAEWSAQNNVEVYYYSMFDDYKGAPQSSYFNMHFGLLSAYGWEKQPI